MSVQNEVLKLRTIVTNMDEFNQLVDQLKELGHRIKNFEFTFSTDENLIPFLVVKDIAQSQLNQVSP